MRNKDYLRLQVAHRFSLLFLTFIGWGFAHTNTLAATINLGCSTTELIDAINQANAIAGADTLELSDSCRYTFSTANNLNNGANALPLITSEITLSGNNSVIERNLAGPRFRFFNVAT